MAMFGGQDLNNYAQWEKVVAPAGQVYYKIPGTGYIYDPVLSEQAGKPLVYVDPTPKLKEAERQKKLQEQAANPVNQAIPVIAGTAGIVGSKYAVDALGPVSAQDKLAEAVLKGASVEAPANTAATVTNVSTDATSAANANTAANANAATNATTEGIGVTPYLGAAGAALSAYGLHNAIEANNVGAGTLSGAGLGLGLGAAAPLVGFGPLGWGALGLMALGGAGFGAGLTSVLGKPSTKEIQAGRFKDVGHGDLAAQYANHDYFAGTGGEKSRDEKFLTADAIRVNPDNYHAADDWDKWSKPAQDEFLNTMLQAGKVSERKGGIYYDDAFAKQQANAIREKYKTQQMGKDLAAKKNARR